MLVAPSPAGRRLHARLREANATLHNEGVLRWDSVAPMFWFADPDGNGLVYLEETAEH